MLRVIVFALGVLLLAACGGAPAAAVTPEQVLAQIKAAGLEAESPSAMQASDYGPAPLLCQDGARRFLIPSMGADKGGRLYVCANADDAAKLKTYYDEMGKASALFASHTFQKGGVLVQINGDLDKAVADKYGAVVAALP
jgi:hypothetical protein